MAKEEHAFELEAFRPPEPADRADTRADGLNRKLLGWLSHDPVRAHLFAAINRSKAGELTFPSRDSAPHDCDCDGTDRPGPPAVPGHMWVKLITRRDRILEILRNEPRQDGSLKYSSRVYAELGGGNFMLAMDPTLTRAHAAQREAFRQAFPHDAGQLQALAFAACQTAGVMAFRVGVFDLADYAEQAALRFCQLLMGYALQDFELLETTLRLAYRALVHQVFERHFITDPVVIPAARQVTGMLLTRTAALIDAYAADDRDALKGCADDARPIGITPVLEMLGTRVVSELNGEQRAILAVGAATGTVGNVQAAACIAVKAIFADEDLRARARKLALDEAPQAATKRHGEWKALLACPLRANPPIPYLPRLEVDEQGNKVAEVLLALGGGTSGWPGAWDDDDPLVWGLPNQSAHNCAGKALAWPLIVEVVRRVMTLPELGQALKPEDAQVAGLKKRHGFACESYPLTFRLDKLRAQTALNVTMRIAAPVTDNVNKLREVIRAGAPRIEQLLRAARHVHFAWFEIIEADTVLVLHTVYDGPFAAYLEHFALQAGDLFDILFEFIEDPPPRPVHKFPSEFAAHLLRYDRAPAMGYFFSAYPDAEVARIVRELGRGP